jgi:hypothetical protein
MLFWGSIRNFYGRYERPISSFFLVLGFIIDALTIKRADRLMENLWILAYLVLIGIFIILIHKKEHEEGEISSLDQAHFWYINILQFCIGGVLSANLVLYFRSTDIFVTWPFMLILALAFISNEFFKEQYIRFSFQISLFFLSIYSFLIFFLPVIFHKINSLVFLLSGFISIIFIFFFILAIFYFTKDRFKESKKLIMFLVLGIFALINFLYFTNLIPPLPLSLKEAGVYHSILKTSDNNYTVSYENLGWKGYFKFSPDFHKTENSPVYVYSAIFSPKDFNITILHEWQKYNEIQKKWKTERTINLPVQGGRDGGFRTYSMRSSLSAGKWRVNIKTEGGHTIGQVRWNIVQTDVVPELNIANK